jgi:hypothetical protein
LDVKRNKKERNSEERNSEEREIVKRSGVEILHCLDE